AQLVHDDALDVVGVEDGQVETGRLVHVGDADDDAVVGVHGLSVDAVAFAQAARYGQGPGRVHARAQRGVDDHPPVAQFVAETLHDHRAVVGDVPGRLPLLAQVRDEVGGGPFVQPGGGDPLAGGVVGQARQLAGERAERAPQLGGAP